MLAGAVALGAESEEAALAETRLFLLRFRLVGVFVVILSKIYL